MIHRVVYPKAEWSKVDAWENLHGQMIPGCPKVAWDRQPWRAPPSGYVHGWRKAHTATAWVYEYPGART